MQELINRITEKTGISAEQANTALHTIKEFVKEKFPMMAGAVDNFFPASSDDAGKTGGQAAGNLEDLLGGGIK